MPGPFGAGEPPDPPFARLTRMLWEGDYDELPAARLRGILKRPHPGVKHPVFKPQWDATTPRKKLAPYLEMSEAELRGKIDEGGSIKGNNFKMRLVACDLARAWALTKEPIYARRAAILLHRYAEVLPKWPVSGSDGVLHPQEEKPYFHCERNDHGGDLWTPNQWYHGNMFQAAPVFRAWDLVCTSDELDKLGAELKTDVRGKILNDLLYRTLKVHLQWPFSYSNMFGFQMQYMAECALALGDPVLVHAVCREVAKPLTNGFFSDGMWKESSPEYAQQIIRRLIECMNILKGYSDPEGYVDPIDGTHIQNFDPLAEPAGARLIRAKAAIDALALPTGYAVAIHDEDYNPQYPKGASKIYGPRPTTSVPRLLGGAGHAVLSAGSDPHQIQAHLHFSGCYGHDHADHLSLVLFAQGEELYSETDYKSDADAGSRAWKAHTAAHNTVMIDEQKLPVAPRDPPNAIHGNLLFWAATDPESMAVEADWKNAQAQVYRRTLALIHLEGNRYYVLDLFRVSGGNTHDWLLHGPLHADYTVETPLALKPRGGKLVEIADLRSGITDQTVSLTFRSGNAAVRALVAAAPGTEVVLGEGPAVRRAGKQTFTSVRRTGGKSVFAAVHEPLDGESRVKNVEVLAGAGDPESPRIVVKLEIAGGRIDYFLSTPHQQPEEREPVFPSSANEVDDIDFSLSDTFAHVVEIKGKVRRANLVGSELIFRGMKFPGTAYGGQIISVERAEAGAKRNAFLTQQPLLAGEELKGAPLILTYADGRTHGYTVERVESANGQQAIVVKEEPGVEITPERALFVYFPGNEIDGPTAFRIVPWTRWKPGDER
jgi:hypothetical protein